MVNPLRAGNDFQAFSLSVDAALKVLECCNKGRFCGRYRLARQFMGATSPKIFSVPRRAVYYSSVCGDPFEGEHPSPNLQLATEAFTQFCEILLIIQVPNCLKTIVQSHLLSRAVSRIACSLPSAHPRKSEPPTRPTPQGDDATLICPLQSANEICGRETTSRHAPDCTVVQNGSKRVGSHLCNHKQQGRRRQEPNLLAGPRSRRGAPCTCSKHDENVAELWPPRTGGRPDSSR